MLDLDREIKPGLYQVTHSCAAVPEHHLDLDRGDLNEHLPLFPKAYVLVTGDTKLRVPDPEGRRRLYFKVVFATGVGWMARSVMDYCLAKVEVGVP